VAPFRAQTSYAGGDQSGCGASSLAGAAARTVGHTSAQSQKLIHWYEAHGIGKRWMKIKRYLD
jgi:hypothetical protein